MSTVIKVENLSKRYIITHKERQRYVALRDVLANKVKEWGKNILFPFRRNRCDIGPSKEEIWALKDLSFEIKQGERVGIIGRNGAGKSTLLKILSRITEPTEGRARIRGRVASLLEVGTGFSQELTGGENIYLNAAILGMDRAQIKRKFDEIVAFSEVEQFLDTPMKRYSSGMQVRLAFAIAAHLEPEILLVDEVLAVGDAGFQKKCLNRMDTVAKQGRTVLFVSHQMGQISTLCQRCLLIKEGRITMDAATQTVIDAYLVSLQQDQDTSLRERKDRLGNGRLRVVDAWLEDANGQRVGHVFSGDRVKFVMQYEIPSGEKLKNILFNFSIHNSFGIWITNLDMNAVGNNVDLKSSRGRLECIVPRLSLNAGQFSCSTMVRIGSSGYEVIDGVQNALTFTVEPGDYFGTGVIVGNKFIMVMDSSWKLVETE